jgi:hypothetical protein
VSNLILSHIIKWFAANDLVLNSNKTNIMTVLTKNSSHSVLHVGCKEKWINRNSEYRTSWFTNL